MATDALRRMSIKTEESIIQNSKQATFKGPEQPNLTQRSLRPQQTPRKKAQSQSETSDPALSLGHAQYVAPLGVAQSVPPLGVAQSVSPKHIGVPPIDVSARSVNSTGSAGTSLCSMRSRLPGAREYHNCYVGDSRAGARNGIDFVFM